MRIQGPATPRFLRAAADARRRFPRCAPPASPTSRRLRDRDGTTESPSKATCAGGRKAVGRYERGQRGLFRDLGIPMMQGRDFRPEDNPAASPDARSIPEAATTNWDRRPAPVAIVNEAIANKYLPASESASATLQPGRQVRHGEIVRDRRRGERLEIFRYARSSRDMVYVPVWRLARRRNAVRPLHRASPNRSSERDPPGGLAGWIAAIPVLQSLRWRTSSTTPSRRSAP